MANTSKKTEADPFEKPATAPIDPKLEVVKKDISAAYRERDDAIQARRKAEARIEELEKENGQLRSLCQKLREDAPPELGMGAYLLTKSVTFSGLQSGVKDGKPVYPMINGTVGDVVALSTDAKPVDVKAIARKLGAGYRVHAVSQETLDTLATIDALRS